LQLFNFLALPYSFFLFFRLGENLTVFVDFANILQFCCSSTVFDTDFYCSKVILNILTFTVFLPFSSFYPSFLFVSLFLLACYFYDSSGKIMLFEKLHIGLIERITNLIRETIEEKRSIAAPNAIVPIIVYPRIAEASAVAFV